MVLGSAAMELLRRTRVMVVGLGGVGSWCAEALVRTGITDIAIVDSDIICATNINRQVQATSENIGESKATELAKRLAVINPSANIGAIHGVFNVSSCGDFALERYDYVIDAIDSIASKVHLIERCVALGVPVYSSMGAGAKTDPSMIRTGLLSKTTVCPLARIIRRNLRKVQVSTEIPCVYSLEPPVVPTVPSLCGSGDCACSDDRCRVNAEGSPSTDWCERKKQINGALVHITAVFGFMLAGMVIQDIAGKAAGGTI
jgi:tRNA threonylcarbamoyladenosine dehydratase